MEAIRDRLREATAEVVELLRAFTGGAGEASDADAVDVLAEAERLGRAADALRVVAAGEVGHRSRPILGPTALSYRLGCANAAELVERVTRVAPATARQRLTLGGQTRLGVTLAGVPLPAEFDKVRWGLATGRLGVDAAREIATALAKAAAGVPTDMLGGVRAAEHELVCAAIGAAPEPDAPTLPPALFVETRIHAALWLARLNPDGVEPCDRRFDGRGFRLHPARDGMVPVSGLLTPEVAGQVQRVFDAVTNPRQSLRFLSETERAERDAAGARDPRTRGQRQHDALATVFDIAGRSGKLPTLGGASPTMIVSTTATEFAAGRGVGHVDGIDEPIPMDAVRQLACTNGIQPVTLTASGRIHRLGTSERTFNRAHRRALAIRDGGASSRAARCPRSAAKCTTSRRGGWAAPRTSTTGCCCAGSITAPSRPAAGASG